MNIELQSITKIFPGKGKRKASVAIDDMTLTIPSGKLVALLGPSGCGKSTTLNMICGLLAPTSGKIFFGDRDMTHTEPENRGVGMVFQNYALYPHLTVMQNIAFPLENLRGKDRPKREEIKKRCMEAAKLVQIDDSMDKRPSELSGGQQQRVAIARALVKMPQVLLLDEPLSNLDARLRLSTREEIRRIQKETGITTVFVTHDQEEAMSISDMIVVMEKSKVIQSGKPQEVYDDPNCLFAAKFLGTPQINTFEARIENGKLYIADDEICALDCDKAGAVTVGIRPEGFIPDAEGSMHCALERVEILGRDMSVIAKHPGGLDANIRAITDPDLCSGLADTVSFRIKKNKLLIFDSTTGERIRAIIK